MAKYNPGEHVYVTISNSFVREAEVLSYSGGFYTIRFLDKSGGTRVRENRLFASRDEAESIIGRPKLKTGRELPKR